MGHTFLFLCMPCAFVFVVEHWTFGSNNVATLEIRSAHTPGFAVFYYYPFFLIAVGFLCAEDHPEV